MILQIRMPVVEQAFGGGRLVRWYVSPGDTFGPGQRICTVAVERAKLVRRTAEKGGLLRRSNGMVNREDTGKGNVYLEVELISNDRGRLDRGLVGEGDEVTAGDALGVVTTIDHDGAVDDGSWRDAPLVRVTARYGDDGEGE
ncbi:MAG: hypothetical protein ABWY62_07515 [Acidimicrobiia bacterium]